MSTPNRDELEGKLERAKGWLKDKAGEATGDQALEAEGEAQNTAGHAQESWGKLKRGVGETVDALGNAISNAGDKINKG